MTPAATSRSATSWATAAGVAMMPIAIWRSVDDAGEVVDRLDGEVADLLRRRGRVGVDQRHDPEAARAEAAVVRERLAEVADADDRRPASPG